MATSLRLRRPPLPHDLRPAVGRSSALRRLVLLLAVALYVVFPLVLSDFWLSVLVLGGITAIATLGLAVLVGAGRELSLGQAFFVAVGAYTAAELGAARDFGVAVWLPAAAAVAALVGAVVAPVVLRLHRQHLAIASLALVVVGIHVWSQWDSLTGGRRGLRDEAEARVSSVDVDRLVILDEVFSRNQGWFWLVWGLVGLTALLTANVLRSHTARALRTVAHDDVAAAVAGVRATRRRFGAFVFSSACAGGAGALTFAFTRQAQPNQWGLALSVTLLAAVVVGGVGRAHGAVLGGLVVGAIAPLMRRADAEATLLDDLDLSASQATLLVVALLLIGFAIFQPRGLAALSGRVARSLRSWPFSDRPRLPRPR